MRNRILFDVLARRYTACRTLRELVDETSPHYRPTIQAFGSDPPEMRADLRRLADAFDAACVIRGSARRAWRGSKPN